MARRLPIILVLVVVVAGTIALPVAAQNPVPKTASVTINEIINFTVTDYGDPGVNFGTLMAGDQNKREEAQVANGGAVQLRVGAETNVACNVQMKGEGDFRNSTGQSIPLGNAKWNTTDSTSPSYPMTTSYATIFASTPGAVRAESIYYWLSVPSSQAAGTYTTTFWYQAVKQ